MTSTKHQQEWLNSAVSQQIIDLNVVSLRDFEAYDRLLYAISDSDRRNDGRIRDKLLSRYSHIESGGWWVSGVDVLTGEDSQWGQFKPDVPYRYQEQSNKGQRFPGVFSDERQGLPLTAFRGFAPAHKEKLIKYEPPKNVPTEIFALKVPVTLWQAIALRYDVSLPENIIVSEGEAMGFWAWVMAHPKIPLTVTEGAKKAGAILTAEYVAIALPGIYNGYRQPKDQWGRKIGNPYLIPQLQAFAQKDREVIFCFDNDTKSKTIKNVKKAIAKTGKLFSQAGCRVSVISWIYPEKGVDDLIAIRGTECFHELFKARLPLSKFNLASLFDLSKYKPLQINERYLSDNLVLPTQAQIIALKSPKGTGKTQWLTLQIDRFIREGKPVLVITHRIQLAKALCSRFGIDHIEEIRGSETQGILGYGLCIDSLHPNSQACFNPEEWQEAVVILDECEQVIWHLLSSSTCTHNRVQIIDNFKRLLNLVITTGGKIFLSDADLSCVAIDYVTKLTEQENRIETWVVENLYCRRQKRILYSYSGSDPRHLIASLVKAIKQNKKLLVHTTGQKARSNWGSINLEAYLKKNFPQLKILRIDSESVSDPNHLAYGCMANLNSILPLYDVVICSPVVETGVSIDIKGYFDSVWGIAQGVQTVDAVCQALERLRDDVPRHIWVKTTAKGNRIGNGSVSIKGILASQHKQTTANIQLLRQVGIRDFDELEVNYSPESLLAWAKRACIVNAGKNEYRHAVSTKLIEQDYELQQVKEEEFTEGDTIRAELKSISYTNYQQYCQAIHKADLPTDNKLEQLQNKKAKTQQERHQERKGVLSKRYGVTVTPAIVELDDKGWYPHLQLHFFLTVGQTYLAQRDHQTLRKIKEQGGELGAFQPDINKRQLLAKVKCLELLNIKQFLDPKATFTKESLAEWFETVIRWRGDIQAILGVSIHPDKDSAIAVAQRLLKKLGLKLTYISQIRVNKIPTRIYQGCSPHSDDRNSIFSYWLNQYQV